ncbi:hypothetical protein [Virgibacillus proomii]|uniref:hypothetical protein n=1 Tax=Virgibacillus proomii TaxID=84407 RepID=UPI001C0F7D63|nr:hypothetical protein [Virgibacillus proomii]MBU5267090.1 hypothetical protein [Virgibacillus proomii]
MNKHPTQKKWFSFSRTELLRQQYFARRKSDFFFQGQSCYDSNTSHAEKVVFFFKDKESFLNKHRTQKSAFLFKDKERFGSDTSHAEKVYFFFKDRESFLNKHRGFSRVLRF